MQTPGTYISAIGHVGLIGWLILGWGFAAEPLVFDEISVSIVSGEEFDQMRAATTPEPGDADPTAPVQPVIDETPPPAPAVIEPTETTPPPVPVAPPDVEVPPPPAPPAPPEAEVADVPPVEPPSPQAPPPTPDVDVSEEPTPPQADRIASTPSAPTPPDTQVDDVVREEVVPTDTAEPDTVVDEQEPTAPVPTATEIAIADLAPKTSARPRARPSRPTPPAAEPEVEPVETAPTPPANEDDVAEALAAALAGETPTPVEAAPAAALGAEMTGDERNSFRIAVNGCWNVDPGSVAARVTVEVGFSLDREGKVQGDVRLISSDGDQSATNTAFEAARRAILRCQSGGYQLPGDKYEQWKDVVITFDPSGMRLR